MKKQMLLTLLLGAAAISTSVVQAAVRVTIPEDSPGIPAYARLEGAGPEQLFPFHTEEWAAIVFYRDPDCVPAEFNLLDFFDTPFVDEFGAFHPGAFGCELRVAGFEIWENGPTTDVAPLFTNLHSLDDPAKPVPVWFVSWPELEAQLKTGVLKITDLEAMASLRKGSATFFKERLHPIGGPGGAVGGARRANMNVIAYGDLDDGGSFRYEAVAGWQGQGAKLTNRVRHVTIELK